MEDNRGPQGFCWRETGVKKAVFIELLCTCQIWDLPGESSGPSPDPQGWGEGWGVLPGASSSGEREVGGHPQCISDWIILRILKGDTSGKRPSDSTERRSGEIEPQQEEDHSSGIAHPRGRP